MRVYIANTTKQIQLFTYRAPDAGQRGPITIPIGGQQMLPDELPMPAIEEMIRHQSRFGFVGEDEIDRLRSEHVVPLCYSIDKPVRPEKIERLVARNEAILTGRGKKSREEAGLASTLAANEMINQERPGDRMSNFEFEITEDRRDPTDGSPQIAEGVRVANDPSETTRPDKSRGRRR